MDLYFLLFPLIRVQLSSKFQDIDIGICIYTLEGMKLAEQKHSIFDFSLI